MSNDVNNTEEISDESLSEEILYEEDVVDLNDSIFSDSKAIKVDISDHSGEFDYETFNHDKDLYLNLDFSFPEITLSDDLVDALSSRVQCVWKVGKRFFSSYQKATKHQAVCLIMKTISDDYYYKTGISIGHYKRIPNTVFNLYFPDDSVWVKTLKKVAKQIRKK